MDRECECEGECGEPVAATKLSEELLSRSNADCILEQLIGWKMARYLPQHVAAEIGLIYSERDVEESNLFHDKKGKNCMHSFV